MEEKLKSTESTNMKQDVIFVSEDEKEKAKRSTDSLDSYKKLIADNSDSRSSNDGTLQIYLEVQDKEVGSDLAKKEDPVNVKDQKELKLELKPELSLKIDAKSLRLEFLKSFDHMHRNDLEELVLQKVVESMMVKSEFADIRSQLDSYEKTLAIYRLRITELSKQFLDLDEVHKQLKIDMEAKNAHFTAPMKITREIGLQVGIPFKVLKSIVTPRAGDQTHAARSMLAPPSSTSSKASTSMRAAGSGASSNAQQKQMVVIDLTGEDDAEPAMAPAAADTNADLRQPSKMAVKRNSLGATTSEAKATGGRTVASGNTVRLSPLQMPRANARQIVTNNGGGQRNSIGSNVTMQILSENSSSANTRLRYSHPAPLPSSPEQPFNPAWKLPPSRPVVRISRSDTGIVISWFLEDTKSDIFADSVSYQIFSYRETPHEPSTDSWSHVGDVKAILLPMAATLNQCQENQRYYFAVRGVDAYQRFGSFSEPKTWS
ncbi:activating transcription factor 7-interacting protein 1-like isoform X2 [Drosophila obscura]|nr:activating transcription factor 7-interacting protein 1-like isoform X2 [Drosophila obscura]